MAEPPPHFLIPPGEPLPGDVVLARFALRECVGEGAQGVVWRADDRVSGADVALKFIHQGLTGQAALRTLARREVAALRLLELPGLVRLVDVGEHQGGIVIAMEWVAGRPFPDAATGAETRVEWDELARPTVVLLETLRRLHGVGLAHRDIKPSNVLITAEGQPIVLDLGVAGGTALAAAHERAGTPRYMPPEALFGPRPDAPPSALSSDLCASDLFAVGVMLFEALAGEPLRVDLQDASDALGRERVLARLTGRAPDEVAELIADLVAPDPARRITTAEDALRALSGAERSLEEEVASVFASVMGARGLATAARVDAPLAFEPLFTARERVVRDRSNASRALFDASGGELAAARRTLRSWLSAGIGSIDAGRVRMEAHDIERLELRRRAARAVEPELARALIDVPLGDDRATSEGPWGARVRAAAKELEGRVESGALDRVLDDLPALTAVAQEFGLVDVRDDLLQAWLRAAIGRSNRRALETLLYIIERDDLGGGVPDCVRAIGQAALAGLDGALERAESLLAGVRESSAETLRAGFHLSFCRHAVALTVGRARGPARAREVLAEVRAWALDAGRPVPALDTWEGWILYQEGEFERAVEHHLRAASLSQGEYRTTALLAASSAAPFADRPDLAQQCAEEAESQVVGRRQIFAATRAAALALAARYARCEALTPDLELIDVLRNDCPHSFAKPGLLQQAAIAWRCGQRALAVELCDAAREGPTLSGFAAEWLLYHSFAVHLGAREDAPDAPTLASPGLPPGFMLQAAALIAGTEGVRADLPEPELRAAWRALHGRNLEWRREILSLRECRDFLARRGVHLEDSQP